MRAYFSDVPVFSGNLIVNKFVVVSLAFMAWAFYELSGGSDFEPTYRRDVAQATPQKSVVSPEPARITPTPIEQVVTKAATTVPTVQRTVGNQTKQDTAMQAVPASFHTLGSASAPSFQTPVVTATAPANTPTDSGVATEATTQLAALGTGAVILPEKKKDLRQVTGSRVNLRGGPGTSFGVLGVLTRDEEVEILRDEGKGWVKLRAKDTGRVGWMAAKMLTAKED